MNKEIGRKHTTSVTSKASEKGKTAPKTNKGEVPKNMKSKSVIKTVILPNEDINRLGLESEEL